MSLTRILWTESDAPKASILAAAITSGFANGMLLAIINTAAELVTNQDMEARLFFMFLAAFLLFIVTKRYSLAKTTVAVEDMIRKIRVRITDKIRSSELPFVEGLGKSQIYTQLTQDANYISQSATIMTNAFQQAIVLISGLVYIAWLSLPGFVTTLVAIGAALTLYFRHAAKMSQDFRRVTEKEGEYFEALDHVLDGFKEIKLNRRKSDGLFASTRLIADQTRDLKVSTSLRYVTDFMFAQVFFYCLLAAVIFILPTWSAAHADVIIKIVTAIFFIMGPLDVLVGAVPTLTRANVAVGNIYRLEAEVDAARVDYGEGQALRSFVPFENIVLNDIRFHYDDAQGHESFAVGPIDLAVKQGEILFIIGGNGSGKSTLLKLMSGLYFPSGGCLSVDDTTISTELYPSYRELFSIIFTDFHLFDRLYGVAPVDASRIDELLGEMELKDKCEFVDGRFKHHGLSTGQRKRLAFIIAQLDDKPVYVFDELAADQDPTFRRYFYTVALKKLQSEGKTVIAVTHDDAYFHVADRLLKMEYGILSSSEIDDWTK